MPVFKIHKTQNFTVMSNHHLFNRNLSVKSKGLMSIMLALPENWNYSIAGLATLSTDGESCVRVCLTELETNGYLKRTKVRENGKIIDWQYDIYEHPIGFEPLVEKPHVVNPHVEKPLVENPPLLNTKQLNTKKAITKSKDLGAEKPTTLKNVLVADKKSKKAKDIVTMRSMVSAFTTSEKIQSKLLQYFNIRLKKGLKPEQWAIILEDLRNYAGKNADIASEQIDNAIAGGYMQIIPMWQKNKQTKSKFDNTAGASGGSVANMSEDELQEFNNTLASDDSGELIKF